MFDWRSARAGKTRIPQDSLNNRIGRIAESETEARESRGPFRAHGRPANSAYERRNARRFYSQPREAA